MPAQTAGLMASPVSGHTIMRFMSTYQCPLPLTFTIFTYPTSNCSLICWWLESGDHNWNINMSQSAQTRQLVFGSSRTAGRLSITGSGWPVSTPGIKSNTTTGLNPSGLALRTTGSPTPSPGRALRSIGASSKISQGKLGSRHVGAMSHLKCSNFSSISEPHKKVAIQRLIKKFPPCLPAHRKKPSVLPHSTSFWHLLPPQIGVWSHEISLDVAADYSLRLSLIHI